MHDRIEKQGFEQANVWKENQGLHTKEVEVIELFNSDVQYIIPLFQRHYVWDREEQWAPLWEDIKKKASHRLSESQTQQFPHFTGAIVIQQKQTNVNEVKKYEIIDGQQRLTTFQIVLCALRDVCTLYGFDDIRRETDRYILYQGILLDGSENERYKLIPTVFDRTSFISLADERVDDSSGQISLTYIHFKFWIEDFVDGNRNKALSLFHSILNDFGFVQILLDEGDEPERIFESLNARAKSLLQFDLLRNNLFLRARIEQDRDRLYREYWGHFENPYWEQEITFGREKMTLSERFFQHFLMARLGEVNVKPLFNVYQEQLAGNEGVEHELSELKHYSEIYQEMTDCSPDFEIGQAMTFYKTFSITSLHPFILFAINELRRSGSDLSLVFQILESYTMRRLLCDTSGAKNYNRLFSKLIQRLKGRRFDVRNFLKLLSDEKAPANRWPGDGEVSNTMDSFVTDTKANRYILYRIELKKREENPSLENSDLGFDSSFSLEHIMPITWENTWSLPLLGDGDPSGGFYPLYDCKERVLYENLFHDEYRQNNPEWKTNPSEEGLVDESYKSALTAAAFRNEDLHQIGNLTLVTGSLNSSLSNRPFSEKKAGLFQNSLLVLNREICEYDTWDIPQIQQRTGDLCDYFCSIWPSAESFAERIGEPL